MTNERTLGIISDVILHYFCFGKRAKSMEKSNTREEILEAALDLSELAELQTKQNYGDVLNYFAGMMSFLIREGILKDEDPEIMAAQFSSPITVWINLCDREPEREDEVMELVRKHVMQFFMIYRKQFF